MIRAGELRSYVTIEEPGERTASGGTSSTWKEFAKVFAKIEPLTGRELQTAKTLYAEVTTRVTIRYMQGVTTKMRIVADGKRFNIHATVDIGFLHEEIEILCGEVQ